MNEILLISTGGTFHKEYNPKSGELEVNPEARALKMIAQKWHTNWGTMSILAKDSLLMTNDDRAMICKTAAKAKHEQIIIIHGTDTMDQTAAELAHASLPKQIVLTGAMVPFAIDPVEATANLASAIGYLQSNPQHGVYIAMHGNVKPYDRIKKNRTKGIFERC